MFLSGGLIPSSFNCSCAFDSAQVAVNAGDVDPPGPELPPELDNPFRKGNGLGLFGAGGGGGGDDPSKSWKGVLAKLICIGLRSCAPTCIYIYTYMYICI